MNYFQDFDIIQYLEANALWISECFLIIFFSLLLDFFQRRLTRRFAKTLASTRNIWDDALLESVRAPLSLLIWLLGISFAIDIIVAQTHTTAFDFLDSLRSLFVVVILAWFMVRFIGNAESNIVDAREKEGRPIDVTTVDAVTKLLRLSVIITASLVALQTLGFSVSGVLAFGGVGGIAVGFAARDLLANFFGGLMIYMDRPFSVGDWIRSPDRNIEGTVEKIGWRLTLIRTFDKRPLYVPNSAFANISVENPSRMSNRRIYETIGVRYEDAGRLPAIIRDIETMLKSHDEIDHNQTLMVNFNKFAESALEFFVYTFTKTTNWQHFHGVKQDVLFQINNIIESHGAEIAFPTSTIHVDSLPESFAKA